MQCILYMYIYRCDGILCLNFILVILHTYTGVLVNVLYLLRTLCTLKFTFTYLKYIRLYLKYKTPILIHLNKGKRQTKTLNACKCRKLACHIQTRTKSCNVNTKIQNKCMNINSACPSNLQPKIQTLARDTQNILSFLRTMPHSYFVVQSTHTLQILVIYKRYVIYNSLLLSRRSPVKRYIRS